MIFPDPITCKTNFGIPRHPLTRSDIKDLIGLRSENIAEAADAILAGKVCAKASKLLVPSLESLHSFCKRNKEDLIIKHEIMFKNGFMRPRKSLDYVPWTLEDWDKMARKTRINDAALLQFKQVILGTEAGRDWMKGRANQFCISFDDPPQEFEIAYLAWIGGNTDAARQLMDESFQRDYKVLEFEDFDQIPDAMRTADVNDFVGSKCISVTSTFNAKSGFNAPKQKSKYWAEFLSAIVESDGSLKDLHLVFLGERSHNALVRTVKKSESWEIHSTIYVPKQVEKFWTPLLHERPLVHFDIVYAAMDDDEEDVEKHFASITGRSGSLKSLVLSKDYQQDMESWGRQCGDFNLERLEGDAGTVLEKDQSNHQYYRWIQCHLPRFGKYSSFRCLFPINLAIE